MDRSHYARWCCIVFVQFVELGNASGLVDKQNVSNQRRFQAGDVFPSRVALCSPCSWAHQTHEQRSIVSLRAPNLRTVHGIRDWVNASDGAVYSWGVLSYILTVELGTLAWLASNHSCLKATRITVAFFITFTCKNERNKYFCEEIWAKILFLYKFLFVHQQP